MISLVPLPPPRKLDRSRGLRLKHPPSRILAAALLVGVAAVSMHRITLLSRPRFVPDAHSEERFWGWSYRDPAVYAALARSERLFRPGDAVCVESPSPSLDRDWLFSIAAYYLPQQIVETSRGGGTAGGPICRRMRLVISRDGSAHRSKGVASGNASFVP